MTSRTLAEQLNTLDHFFCERYLWLSVVRTTDNVHKKMIKCVQLFSESSRSHSDFPEVSIKQCSPALLVTPLRSSAFVRTHMYLCGQGLGDRDSYAFMWPRLHTSSLYCTF